MREVVLKIPEKNYRFFMELIRQLGYVKIDNEEITVPEHHKRIITERLKTLKPDDLQDWDEIKNEFKLD